MLPNNQFIEENAKVIWHENNDEMVIPLPNHFDMNANLNYLLREKMNVCMRLRTMLLQRLLL